MTSPSPLDLPASQWHSMQSAPKSGLIDLLWCDRRYIDCYWDSICAEYRTIDTSYRLIIVKSPTHWRYPPAPPSELQDRQEIPMQKSFNADFPVSGGLQVQEDAPQGSERKLRALFAHWNEFGAEHGFGELIDRMQGGAPLADHAPGCYLCGRRVGGPCTEAEGCRTATPIPEEASLSDEGAAALMETLVARMAARVDTGGKSVAIGERFARELHQGLKLAAERLWLLAEIREVQP